MTEAFRTQFAGTRTLLMVVRALNTVKTNGDYSNILSELF